MKHLSEAIHEVEAALEEVRAESDPLAISKQGWISSDLFSILFSLRKFQGMCSCNYLNDSNLRRGRESNPRIEVLQTPTLPLGYPAPLNANGEYERRIAVSTQRRSSKGSAGEVE